MKFYRGFFFGLLFVMPFWIIVALLLTGCIHATPKQAAFFYSPEPPVVATAQEIRELLPAFAEIPDGNYTLVSRGTMPRAEWCNPFVGDIMMHKDWNCIDFSHWADDNMPPNAAFGVAWNEGTDWKPGHMVAWFIDTDRQVILYDPQSCQFTRIKIQGMKI